MSPVVGGLGVGSGKGPQGEEGHGPGDAGQGGSGWAGRKHQASEVQAVCRMQG